MRHSQCCCGFETGCISLRSGLDVAFPGSVRLHIILHRRLARPRTAVSDRWTAMTAGKALRRAGTRTSVVAEGDGASSVAVCRVSQECLLVHCQRGRWAEIGSVL